VKSKVIDALAAQDEVLAATFMSGMHCQACEVALLRSYAKKVKAVVENFPSPGAQVK
jgi:hypothetical protein